MPAAQEKITPQTPEQQTQFKARLDNLLSQEVTVENINDIAEDSLDAVIGIAGDCIDDYRQNLSPPQQEGIKQLQPAEQEEAAFRHYGLGSVPEVLDTLQEKVDGIHQIDNFLQALPEEDFVVLPPDSSETNLGSGSGEYERAEITPRLKTLLFIANQSLGVDLKDITVTKGTNTSEMMRQESYVGVEIPELDRLVLVCDEQGNATYVFDSKALEQQSLTAETLLVQTKQELNNLLQQYPELGIRLIYGPQWAGRIANLLTNELAEGSKNEPAEPITLLESVEKAPENVLSTNTLAKALGVDHSAARNAIIFLQETMPEEFGETKTYRFGSRHADGFSPKQQELVESYLKDKGLFAPQVPEDIMSTNALRRELGVANETIRETVASLQETDPKEFGKAQTYRFGSTYTIGLTTDQQEMVKTYLENEGKLAPLAPEDILSVRSFAKELSTTTQTVDNAIASLQEAMPEEFGEVRMYRFGPQSAKGFSHRQQEMVKTYLENEGKLAPLAPEGVLSVNGLAEDLGVGYKLVERAITYLQETDPKEFGKAQTYRFGTRSRQGLSSKQQELVEAHLGDQGLSNRSAPEGTLSANGLAKELGISYAAVQRAITSLQEAMPEEFGNVQTYRFGSRYAEGFTSEQQKMTENYLRDMGRAALSPQNNQEN